MTLTNTLLGSLTIHYIEPAALSAAPQQITRQNPPYKSLTTYFTHSTELSTVINVPTKPRGSVLKTYAMKTVVRFLDYGNEFTPKIRNKHDN